MEVIRWLLITPLVAAWAWGLWNFSREREYRLLVPVVLLPALAIRHFLYPLAADTWLGFLAEGPLVVVLTDVAINVLAVVATLFLCSSVRERNRAEQVQSRTLDTLGRVADFFVDAQGPFEGRLKALLQLGCTELAADAGVFAILRDGEYEIRATHAAAAYPISPGDRIDPDLTYCQQAGQSADVLAIEDTGIGHWARHPAREIQSCGSYIGIPIRLGNELCGSLYFISSERRRQRFTSVDRTLLELMAHWLASSIEQRRKDRDRVAAARLQSAALEFSHLALENNGQDDALTTALERLKKTLDLAGAAIVCPSTDEGELETIAAVGSSPSAGPFGANFEPLAAAIRAGRSEALEQTGTSPLGSSDSAATAVCVPLRSGADRLGSLVLYGHQPRRFGGEELDFALLAANLISETVAGIRAPEPSPAPEDASPPRADAVRRELVPRRRDELEPTRLDLHWAVERLAEDLSSRTEPAIRLHLELAPETPEVALYRYELDRILEGLIACALEISPNRELTLATRTLRPESETAETFALLSLRANGTRVSGEHLAKLYEEASSHSAAATPTVPSLARMERLLKDHGGDLSVLSECDGEHDSDCGVTFTAYLPVARPA